MLNQVIFASYILFRAPQWFLFIISGVYSPSDTGWEDIIQTSWRMVDQVSPDNLGIEFIYITNSFPFTLQNVNIGKIRENVDNLGTKYPCLP